MTERITFRLSALAFAVCVVFVSLVAVWANEPYDGPWYDACGDPCPPVVPQFHDPFSEDIPPDINGDCVVDVYDMLRVLAEWGECEVDCCRSDFDRDGIVGADELLTVLEMWTVAFEEEL